MDAALDRRRARLDWRGAALVGVGCWWIWQGAGLILTQRQAVTAATAPLRGVMPLCAWGWGWIGCGLLAGAAGALPRTRDDHWGFAAAAMPPLVWALVYAVAAPGGFYREGWASVPPFGAVVTLLVIVVLSTRGRRRTCTCERGAPSGR